MLLNCSSGDVVSRMPLNLEEGDMELIYEALGNGVRHSLTKRFVENGYDTERLKRELARERNQSKGKERE